MDEERVSSLKELENRLGFEFKKIEWLDQALTHKSFIYQTVSSGKISNEVLEFLGDAVLSLVVSHLLFEKFPEAQEGALSMMRSHFVKQGSLAFLAREIGLEKYLLLGKSEVLDGGGKKSSILANAYEAVIGAIYLDSGLDPLFEIVQNHLESHLLSEAATFLFNDYKSLLQEESQKIHGNSPRYQVLKEFGPEHDKRYEVSVMIAGKVKGTGQGRSKKLAEQEAAKMALQEIDASEKD